MKHWEVILCFAFHQAAMSNWGTSIQQATLLATGDRSTSQRDNMVIGTQKRKCQKLVVHLKRWGSRDRRRSVERGDNLSSKQFSSHCCPSVRSASYWPVPSNDMSEAMPRLPSFLSTFRKILWSLQLPPCRATSSRSQTFGSFALPPEIVWLRAREKVGVPASTNTATSSLLYTPVSSMGIAAFAEDLPANEVSPSRNKGTEAKEYATVTLWHTGRPLAVGTGRQQLKLNHAKLVGQRCEICHTSKYNRPPLILPRQETRNVGNEERKREIEKERAI